MDAEEAKEKREVLVALKRRRHEREVQAALQGVNADPIINIEIEDLTKQINVIERELGDEISKSSVEQPQDIPAVKTALTKRNVQIIAGSILLLGLIVTVILIYSRSREPLQAKAAETATPQASDPGITSLPSTSPLIVTSSPSAVASASATSVSAGSALPTIPPTQVSAPSSSEDATHGSPPIIGKRLTIDEWRSYVANYRFGDIPPSKIILRHTVSPTVEQWKGESSISAIQSFFNIKGWSAGSHIYVAPDGIWLFTPMNQVGIHSGVGNSGTIDGKFWYSIGVTMVGNYDNQLPSGEVWENTQAVLGGLAQRLGGSPEELIAMGREYTPTKTSPGRAVSKEWVLDQIKQWLAQAQPLASSNSGSAPKLPAALDNYIPTFTMLPFVLMANDNGGSTSVRQFFGYTRLSAGNFCASYQESQCHNPGIDFAMQYPGTPLLAVANGLVVCTGPECPFGAPDRQSIIIRYGSIYAVYKHIQEMSVTAGQLVQPGDVIGKSGDVFSFEVRPIPPEMLGNSDLNQAPANARNAVNPLYYFSPNQQNYFEFWYDKFGAAALFCQGALRNQDSVSFGGKLDQRPCASP